MASSFDGINTALTSLYAQRRGLDVTGRNIANASTEGCTGQRVEMQSQVGSLSPARYARTIDLPKTIMEMQLQQASYQAALAAGARVIQPSLIDFLR